LAIVLRNIGLVCKGGIFPERTMGNRQLAICNKQLAKGNYLLLTIVCDWRHIRRVIGEKSGLMLFFSPCWNLESVVSWAMAARTIKQTRVYLLAFEQAMELFEISKSFPNEERYSLTDQVRRSSRSVCICLLEAWRKRQYPLHFAAKVSDSDMENSETSGWIDFALACSYLEADKGRLLLKRNEEIGRLLHHMLTYPERY
jgi:four helix bundle protein